MDQSSGSGAAASGQAESASAPAAKKKKVVKKETQDAKYFNNQGARADLNNDLAYWKKANKGYLFSQLDLRGYRPHSYAKFKRLTVVQLADVRIP